MTEQQFPEPEIISLIEDQLDGFLGLKLKSVVSKIHPTFHFKYCDLEFEAQKNKLNISLVKRDWTNIYGLSFFISRDKYKHMSFSDYLKFIKSNDLEAILNNQDLSNYSSVEAQILLFKKYLSTDLKKIFTEGEWIEVPFERD